MRKLLFLLSLIVIISGCKQRSGEKGKTENVDLTGAGATFPLPYYNLIFKNYSEQTSNKVTYGGIGSGGGIRSLKDKTVDFGASDVFLSDKEIKEMGSEVLHIPTCMGAVAIAYNLPGINNLKLTGDLITEIFLGKITTWNDPKIKKINEGFDLPDKKITVVYRSDGSGTTYVFSDYLTKVNAEWAEKIGTGKSLKWPVGIAAKGNPGVANMIQQTEGAIGYIGSEYSFSLNISTALLLNASGNFVEATIDNISASANIDLPSDMRIMITNSTEANAYPISCFTWIILYKDQAYTGKKEVYAKGLKNLLEYMLDDESQNMASKVHYAPLPESARNKAKALLNGLNYEGKNLSGL